jgi:ferritin-like metal-binding protein YciE
MQLRTLNDLFAEQLADLHSAETQLVDALPTMAAAASHDELKQAKATRSSMPAAIRMFGTPV